MASTPDPIDGFIARWQDVTASELATAQSFVIDLCRLLDLPERLVALNAERRVEEAAGTVRWLA